MNIHSIRFGPTSIKILPTRFELKPQQFVSMTPFLTNGSTTCSHPIGGGYGTMSNAPKKRGVLPVTLIFPVELAFTIPFVKTERISDANMVSSTSVTYSAWTKTKQFVGGGCALRSAIIIVLFSGLILLGCILAYSFKLSALSLSSSFPKSIDDRQPRMASAMKKKAAIQAKTSIYFSNFSLRDSSISLWTLITAATATPNSMTAPMTATHTKAVST